MRIIGPRPVEHNGLRGFVTTFHFGNTHSPDTSPRQVNSPASTSSPEPGTPFSPQVFSMSSPADKAGPGLPSDPATLHASRNGEGA